MKGIVFNILEQVVTREHGDETWDALLEAAKLDGSFTSVGSYLDEQLYALVGAASAALNLPPDDVVRWFGQQALPEFHKRYPRFFESHTSARSFVLTLNDIIHPEVRKLFPGAYAPHFNFDDSVEGQLTLEYVSERQMCSFAEGLIEGAATHFGESVQIEQPQCSKHGADTCLIVCTFAPLPAAAGASS